MATKVFCRYCGKENLLEPEIDAKADKMLCQYCDLRMTTNVELLINLGIADITLPTGTMKCRCKWTSLPLAACCFKCGYPFTLIFPGEKHLSSWSFSEYNMQKVGDILLERYLIAEGFQKCLSIDYIAFDREKRELLRIKTSPDIDFINRIADIWLNIPYHKNVLKAYSKEMIHDRPHLFLEYVEGKDLRKRIEEKNLDILTVLEIAIQICEGMEHLWSIGLVHRDLKPSNIIIGDDSIMRINDFEIAEVATKQRGLAEIRNGFCGTPLYMSPEQWEGLTNIDNRSDIYSFGVTLYEMICGINPFKYMFVVPWKGNKPPAPEPKTIKPDCPEVLNNLISKCLKARPEDRYQSFGEVKEELYKIKGII